MKRKIKSNWIILTMIFFICTVIIGTGCFEDDNDEEKQYHVTFMLDGIQKDFILESNMYLINDDTKWYSYWSSSNGENLTISFAPPVTSGTTFHESDDILIEYNDTSGNQYKSGYGNVFLLTISKWEGSGGLAAGTFVGDLGQTEPIGQTGTVSLTEGAFEADIN